MRIFLSMILSLSVLASLTSKASAAVCDPSKLVNATFEEQVAVANRAFGFQIFNAFADSKDGMVISPLSLHNVLSIAQAGASEGTATDMAHVLRLSQQIKPKDLGAGYKSLNAALQSSTPELQWSSANFLVSNANAPVRPQFIKLAGDAFLAEALAMDFGDRATIGAINDKVKQLTGGQIGQILKKLDNQDRLVIANAVALDAKFSSPFSKDRTIQGEFRTLSGAKKQHPMMNQTTSFPYLANSQMQMVRLPYGAAGAQPGMYLDIILPKDGTDFVKFAQGLQAEDYFGWVSQASTQTGRIALSLPRHRIAYTPPDLKKVLTQMGMGSAFDLPRGSAHFKGIDALDNVYISQLIHQALIDTNETGSKGAAATVAVMTTRSMQMSTPMVVNRPFIFVVNRNDIPLFIGTVTDPEDSAR